MLSEEAQEARNKDCKRFREDYTRKFSRLCTMEDLFHLLLVTSDPVITQLRRSPNRHSKGSISKEVYKTLYFI